MHPTPCIHGDRRTLCPSCQEQHDADPTAWAEYGHHPEGEARWHALQAEMAAARAELAARTPPDTTDWPL